MNCPGTSEKHNGGRNVSFLIMTPRAWLRLANEQDVTTHGPSPVESSPIRPSALLSLSLQQEKTSATPRGGGARRQRHRSLIAGERVYHYGSRNRRTKGDEERVLLNLASKVTLAFSFRSVWRHRMDIDLVLIPFRPARGRPKRCFSVALLERGAPCAFPEQSARAVLDHLRYQA